ncbi:MAG TPA: glycosyltransferase family 39 protein [Candidatus Sulfotelmatobacter sp.]|nr:glycosyltransferase family 39 protein [Candidatus Sulfotelmatobacter sp.]
MAPLVLRPSLPWSTPALVVLSAIFIYLQVFVLPCTPRLASGDQAIYLHHATRMLAGELIYRDYDHFTFPGTDVLYAALFKLFGVHAWIPQAMLVVLGATLVWLIFRISRKLISGTTAYLPALLFIALPFSSYLDATHHWYSLVAVTAALAILLERRTPRRLAWAGACVGIATFFTQSMALLAIGFALFLLWEHNQAAQSRTLLLTKQLSLLLSFSGTLAACMSYFVWKVGLKQIWYYTVVFVAKYYPADWFNNWHVYLTGRPQLHAWTTWLDLPAFALMHLLVPSVYVLFSIGYFFRWWPTQSGEERRRLMLINITGLFLFLTVASAPAYSRLYVVSPPALILLAWIFQSRIARQRLLLRLTWLMVFVVLFARPLVTQIRWKAHLDLPTGRTAFFDPLLYDKCKWMSERTHPSDYFFGDHLLAFTLRLRNVGRVPFLRPTDYTRPEEVADAIQALDKFQVRFVSWYIGLDREKDAVRHPEGNHLASIRQYLLQHYHVAKTFANGDQIWQRNSESN